MKYTGAKKHHFVPECYLKKFLLEDHFYVLDLAKVKKNFKEYPKRKHPGTVCYDHKFYSIEKNRSTQSLGIDQYDPLHVETKVLQCLEKIYPSLFNKIITQQELALTDAIDLSDFIIQIKIRNPFHLEHTIRSNQSKWINQSASDIVDNDKEFSYATAAMKKELKDLITSYQTDPDYAKGIQLSGLIERNNQDPAKNERTRKALVNCSWKLLITPKHGPYFITSDNPGVSVGKSGYIDNTRFINGFSFYFPLSYQYCLLISDETMDYSYDNKTEHKAIDWQTISKVDIENINHYSTHKINKLVIGSDKKFLNQLTK